MANELVIRITGNTLEDGRGNTEFDIQVTEWSDEKVVKVLELLAYGMIALAIKNPQVVMFAGKEELEARARALAGVNEQGEKEVKHYDPRDGIVL